MSIDAISSLDLDDEDFRVRAMQGVAEVPYTPLSPASASSISKAEERDVVPQHRPTLPAPKNILLDLINSHIKLEKLIDKATTINKGDFENIQASLDQLQAEKQEALENEAKAAKARMTWNTLSIVAQYVSSVGMIVLGSALGGWPAGLLIAAGVVGVGNRVIHDTNFLQAAVAWYTKSEELQKKIVHTVEMGTFFLQMGLGLAGGVVAWQTGALAAAQVNGAAIQSNVKTILAGATGVISAGAKIGSSYYEKRIAHLQAQVRKIETMTTINQLAMYQEGVQMSKMIESAQSQVDQIRRAIQVLEVPQD